MPEKLQNTDVCQGWGPKGEAGQKLEIDMLLYKKNFFEFGLQPEEFFFFKYLDPTFKS